MKVKELNTVRFAPKSEDGFFDTVTARVNTYFEANHISPYASTQMWVKTIVMLLLYFTPYILMVTLSAGKSFLFFLMGCGMIGIGTSVDNLFKSLKSE